MKPLQVVIAHPLQDNFTILTKVHNFDQIFRDQPIGDRAGDAMVSKNLKLLKSGSSTNSIV